MLVSNVTFVTLLKLSNMQILRFQATEVYLE